MGREIRKTPVKMGGDVVKSTGSDFLYTLRIYDPVLASLTH